MSPNINKAEPLPAPTDQIPPFVCPACGLVHTPEDYASLPAECQVLMATISLDEIKAGLKA